MTRRRIAILYIAVIHLLLGLALVRPDFIAAQHWRFGLQPPEPSAYVAELHRSFRAIDANLTIKRPILLGDSHFQLMDENLLRQPVVNFGAGHDTLRNMAQRLRDYGPRPAGTPLLIWGGHNDLRRRDADAVVADFRQLIAVAGGYDNIIILAIPPVAANVADGQQLNRNISKVNDAMAAQCQQHCRFINVHDRLADTDGQLAAAYDSGDGVHLNGAGYQLVAAMINQQLEIGNDGQG